MHMVTAHQTLLMLEEVHFVLFMKLNMELNAVFMIVNSQRQIKVKHVDNINQNGENIFKVVVLRIYLESGVY